jgi:hypothetical protein
MSFIDRLPPTTTRVEQHTAPEVNQLVHMRTDADIARLEGARPVQFEARLAELDREWDIERVLQLNASIFSMLGLVLGTRVDRRFLLLPTAVFTFFAQHALQGWCPPIPLFRRLGVRTAREVQRERAALKAMRGDFDRLPHAGSADREARVRAVLRAVDA